MKERLKYWYEHKYKFLLIFPMLIVLLALIQIGWQYRATGDFVHRGITLKGGSTITITQQISLSSPELEQFLQEQFSADDISVRTIGSAGKPIGFAIDSDFQAREDIDKLITTINQKIPLRAGSYSVEIVDSSLGHNFFLQTAKSLGIAFILMSIVVFIYLRTTIPSLTVVLAAVSDITVTIAVFNLTGVKLSSAGVAAFLMLVGYSVDTDLLLSVRVLKQKEGSVMDRVYSSVKTGLVMTTATLSAVIVALLLVNSDVVKQIMLILCIGLLVDPIMTWIQNVAILRWYLEAKKHE